MLKYLHKFDIASDANNAMGDVDPRLQEQLRSLLEIRNSLAGCDSIEAVVAKATHDAIARVRSQTASIFLFDKHGLLQRMWIEGADSHGSKLSNDWFSEERYLPGESFTGPAVLPIEGGTFGQPQWSNNLAEDKISENSAEKYREKLGRLRCAVAIPLSGRHRTFGVLEIINKNDSSDRFEYEDVYWLSLIGSAAATRISQLRQENELRILADIGRLLVEPFGSSPGHANVYDLIADKLTGSLTYYRACVIRVGQESIAVVGKSGDEVDWRDFNNSPVRLGEYPAGETLAAGKLIKMKTLKEKANSFLNSSWIQKNSFESFICLPLQIGSKSIGTLSLFLGFQYDFYDNDIEFLQNVAFLIAAYSESSRVIGELQAIRDDIEEQRHRDLSTSRMIGYELAREEKLHRYKNEYQSLISELEKARKDSTSQREREDIIKQQIEWGQSRLKEVRGELAEAAPSEVNVNHVIQSVWRVVSRQASGRKIEPEISFDKDIPELWVHEGEIREVVYNLLANAVRAVRDADRVHGVVEISTGIAHANGIDYVEIQIADNGVGIPNEHLLRIFDRGFSTYRQQGGTGLGLFLTKRIVEEHYAGKLLLETEWGQGSSFTVRLPIKRLTKREERKDA